MLHEKLHREKCLWSVCVVYYLWKWKRGSDLSFVNWTLSHYLYCCEVCAHVEYSTAESANEHMHFSLMRLAMTKNGTCGLWEKEVRFEVMRCKLMLDCCDSERQERNGTNSTLFAHLFPTELFGLAHDCHQICNSECQPSRDRSSTSQHKHAHSHVLTAILTFLKSLTI